MPHKYFCPATTSIFNVEYHTSCATVFLRSFLTDSQQSPSAAYLDSFCPALEHVNHLNDLSASLLASDVGLGTFDCMNDCQLYTTLPAYYDGVPRNRASLQDRLLDHFVTGSSFDREKDSSCLNVRCLVLQRYQS